MELGTFYSASRVVIVAGKGGVGTTTVSAVLGSAAARTGASVLIVEVEGKSGLATMLGCAPLGYEEVEVAPGLRARTLTPDQALLEYLDERGLGRVSRQLVRTGVLDVVAGAIPGMKDVLVLGKVKQLEQSGSADLIVVDAPAAGHAVTFLTSARGLLETTRGGPIRDQAREVADLIADPARTQALLVTTPEETPVNELVDTAFALEDRAGLHLGPVVVNGIPDDVAPTDPGRAGQDAAMVGIVLDPAVLTALAAATRMRHDAHVRAMAQAERLATRLPLPQIRLPLLAGEIGPAEIDRLAAILEAGVTALPAVRR